MKIFAATLAVLSSVSMASDIDSLADSYSKNTAMRVNEVTETKSGTKFAVYVIGNDIRVCFLEKEGAFFCMKDYDFMEIRGR